MICNHCGKPITTFQEAGAKGGIASGARKARSSEQAKAAATARWKLHNATKAFNKSMGLKTRPKNAPYAGEERSPVPTVRWDEELRRYVPIDPENFYKNNPK